MSGIRLGYTVGEQEATRKPRVRIMTQKPHSLPQEACATALEIIFRITLD